MPGLAADDWLQLHRNAAPRHAVLAAVTAFASASAGAALAAVEVVRHASRIFSQ